LEVNLRWSLNRGRLSPVILHITGKIKWGKEHRARNDSVHPDTGRSTFGGPTLLPGPRRMRFLAVFETHEAKAWDQLRNGQGTDEFTAGRAGKAQKS